MRGRFMKLTGGADTVSQKIGILRLLFRIKNGGLFMEGIRTHGEGGGGCVYRPVVCAPARYVGGVRTIPVSEPLSGCFFVCLLLLLLFTYRYISDTSR